MAVVAAPVVPTRALVRDSEGGYGIPPPPAVAPYGSPGPYVYDAGSAMQVPAVSRAVQLYSGLVKQMPIDVYQGYTRVAPTPRFIRRPDPTNAGSWYVQVSVEDYLLSGNTVSYVTRRGYDGWPLAVQWLPITWVSILWEPPVPGASRVRYFYLGQELDPVNVIHVKRGADRMFPVRGVGVVEEHLSTLDRVAMEEEYERGALSGGAVPSVAVITPQPEITNDVAEEAKDAWLAKFSGPQREPVILPNGTQVIPLAWSPTDTQLSEARRQSLQDVANMFNLDGYWLGSPVSGMTYRTAGPQYQQVLRTSLEPVLADFEDVWSDAWLPYGTDARFRRSQLLREDLATAAQAAQLLYGAGIMALPEARVEVGLPPDMPGAIGAGADMAQPAAPADPNETMPGPGETGGEQV